MGSKTAYLESALLEHVLGNTPYTPPATLYVVLSYASFDPTLTGFSVLEFSGGGYVRLALSNDTTNFPASTGGNPATLSNGTDWAFPTPTADWGTVMSIYLADSGSHGGNLLYGTDVVGAGVAVVTGAPFTVSTGDFVVRET